MTESFILDVMDKFNASDIVDLDLSNSDIHISLKKKDAAPHDFSAFVDSKSVSESGSGNSSTEEKTEKKGDSSSKTIEEISTAEVLKSPIVGTFYRSPSPDSPAYAEKGMVIKKGEPVCIIEAMKMMNTLNADYDFEVLEVLAENGTLIEFDQPLFSIKKL